MAKKEVDGEGLNIPNRIKALPVKRPGPIVAAVIVVLLAAMLIQGLITNPRLDWPTVWKYLFNENVLEGIRYTLELTVISMVVAIILSVILAIMRKSINPVLRGVSWFFIWFFRGTPVYTQLIFWGLFAVLIPDQPRHSVHLGGVLEHRLQRGGHRIQRRMDWFGPERGRLPVRNRACRP